MIQMIKHINFRTLTLLLVIAVVAAGSFGALSSVAVVAGQGNNKHSRAARITNESTEEGCERKWLIAYENAGSWGESGWHEGNLRRKDHDKWIVGCLARDIGRVKHQKPRIDTSITRPKKNTCKRTCWDTLRMCYPYLSSLNQDYDAEVKGCEDAYYACAGQCASSPSRKNIPSPTKQRKPRS